MGWGGVFGVCVCVKGAGEGGGEWTVYLPPPFSGGIPAQFAWLPPNSLCYFVGNI